MKAADWKRPPPLRLHTILERLAGRYGHTHGEPHHAPIDELILTVLSQNTNDRNRDVAYARLRARFRLVGRGPRRARGGGGGGDPARRAGADQVASHPSHPDALDDDDLTAHRGRSAGEARDELCALPGVGRKTAACVLLFAFGRHDLPVDTHVLPGGDPARPVPARRAARGVPRRAAAAVGPTRTAYESHVR